MTTRFEHGDTGVFNNLWIHTYLTKTLAQRLVPRAELEALEDKNLLPDIHPIYSRISFQRFLETEGRMPKNNRYAFIHLIVPHAPFILRADGSYAEPDENGKIPRIQPGRSTARPAGVEKLLGALGK